MPNWLSRRRAEPVELDVLDAYAQWADVYAPEAHNPLMQLEEQAVRELLPEVAGQRLWALACGSGLGRRPRPAPVSGTPGRLPGGWVTHPGGARTAHRV